MKKGMCMTGILLAVGCLMLFIGQSKMESVNQKTDIKVKFQTEALQMLTEKTDLTGEYIQKQLTYLVKTDEKEEGLKDASFAMQNSDMPDAQDIYFWSEVGAEATDTYAYYDYRDEDYDAHKIDDFIGEYLAKQGIRLGTPDGMVYDAEGKTLVEYYMDEESDKFCFIFHLWTRVGNPEKYEFKESVWCTTHTISEADRIEEPDGNTVQGYYIEDEGIYIYSIGHMDIDLSKPIEYQYRDDGSVMQAEYIWSSGYSGTMEFDGKNRMIYNEYCVTHGVHCEVFLYKEDSIRPWACFTWCGFAPGFESVYLYLE